MGVFPSRSALQACIRAIQPATLQTLNASLMQHWLSDGVVNIEHLRIDSTVVKSNITPPSDSQLLNDGIRVLSRLLSKAKDYTGFRFTDQRKKAKSLAFRIFNAKKAEKDRLYPELLRLAVRVVKQVDRALLKITCALHWRARLIHFKNLLAKVMDQTICRVIHQRSIPSSEKIVSLFEPHTDVIVKGVRAVAFQKPVGLSLTEMGLKQKTLKKLAHFRAGIEGNISELKRRFGCSVARWKGEEGFQAFVWSSILSDNLMRWVRLLQ